MKKQLYPLLVVTIFFMSCQSDEPNENQETPDLPPFELTQNTISLSSSGMTNDDIIRTFYDVSGTFIYHVDGKIYGFYPGVADWSLGNAIEEISPRWGFKS
jgi:hypothetical protein